MNSMPPPETMKGLKPFGPQVGEQFEHGLDPKPFQYKAVWSWDASRWPAKSFTIRSNSSVVIPAWVAITISNIALLASRRHRGLEVAFEQGGEGLLVFPFGMGRGERLHPVEGEEELEVQGLLGPEGAIVVEGGDALGDRDEVRLPSLVTFSTKATIAFFVWLFYEGKGSVWAIAGAMTGKTAATIANIVRKKGFSSTRSFPFGRLCSPIVPHARNFRQARCGRWVVTAAHTIHPGPCRAG